MTNTRQRLVGALGFFRCQGCASQNSQGPGVCRKHWLRNLSHHRSRWHRHARRSHEGSSSYLAPLGSGRCLRLVYIACHGVCTVALGTAPHLNRESVESNALTPQADSMSRRHRVGTSYGLAAVWSASERNKKTEGTDPGKSAPHRAK